MRLLLFSHVLVAFLVQITSGSNGPPSLYKCVDWDCEDWISKGKTLLLYMGRTDKHLSFKKNQDILIVGKPVDESSPDWIGKLGNKIGLVPKDYVREDKMNKSPPKFTVGLHEISAWSNNNEVKHEAHDDEAEDHLDADDDEEDVNEVGIEDVDDISTDDNSSLPPPETPIVKEQTESVIPENEQSVDATLSIKDITAENLQTQPVVQSSPSIIEQETGSLAELESKPSVRYDDEAVISKEEEISSESIILQPSTDTAPQGTATTEYLPETPKTVEQNPTDNITQQIPETVVLDNIASIQSSVLGDGGITQLGSLEVTRVQEPAEMEEETQSVVPVEENTASAAESSIKPEFRMEYEVSLEDSNIAPRNVEAVEPEKVPETMRMENTETSPEAVAEAPSEEMDSSTPLTPSNVESLENLLHESTSGQESESLTNLPSNTHLLEPLKKEGYLENNIPEPSQESESSDAVESSSHAELAEEGSLSVEELQSNTVPVGILKEEESSVVDEPRIDIPNPVENDSAVQSRDETASTPTPPTEEVTEFPVNDIEETTATTESSPAEEIPEEEKTPVEQFLAGIEQTVSFVDVKSEKEQQQTPIDAPVPSDENQNLRSGQLDSEAPAFPVEDVPSQITMVEPTVEVETLASKEAVFIPDVVPSDNIESETQASGVADEVPTIPPPFILAEESQSTDVPPQEAVPDDSHDDTHGEVHDNDDHQHHHHHHHHHRHNLFKDTNDTETSSLILVIKHISSTLLSFLPEPLQDTILDVDDALVLTGIIALTLVSICVPYFLIEAHMSLRPLKKKVVELNKSLWKVSAAYETQQEEFEIFKQKAIAHDEFKKRAEQSENDVVILKKLETKHREQITALKNQLKSQMKEAVDIRALIEKTLEAKKVVAEECEKYKTAYESIKGSFNNAKDELNNIQTQAKSSALLLNVSGKNVEVLNSKISMLEQEAEEMKTQLATENEKRKTVEKGKHNVEQSKAAVERELTDIKNICHQYEESVSSLNDEISKLESELTTIKETLGDDSPLLEVAEIQAKAAFSEKEANSLRTRLDGLSADNDNLSGKVKEMSSALEEAQFEREKTNNRLQVLEKYFKEREEEYIKTIEQLQLKESVRDKGKEELIKIIEEKENVCRDLDERLEALKEEFEETKQQHRNEIRTLEAKGHENWLSLCQAERKAQDARKEAQQLRQRLTALSKEKDDEDGDGLNGEVMFPVLPDELVPLPIFDEPSPYFDLGDDFVPPPPLPEGGEIEPHRPPPLGGRLSPSFSDYNDNVLSPIVGRRDDDCTDGSSGSNSPRRSPPLRGGWVNVPHDHDAHSRDNMRGLSRATSSPVQRGVNL